ncbi:hypothetical protein [Pseudonocardia aurantiaca]|uniref:Phosphopantetheine adenylyltransferase n=1 Tax=Pseudonocardia aurantiaca TaxID=75290 RepID=A0ABW4FH20_9PSEU
MSIAVSVLLLVAGVVNGLPVAGLAGAAALRRLYGVEVADPDLLVLMRHRAVLLGLLGAALIVAAVVPQWRLPAAVAGLVSMLAFVGLAAVEPARGRATVTTMRIDAVLGAALAVAVGLELAA